MVHFLQPEPVSEVVCYAILGTALIVMNLPLLYIILSKKALIVRYAVISILFLNCIFTGMLFGLFFF